MESSKQEKSSLESGFLEAKNDVRLPSSVDEQGFFPKPRSKSADIRKMVIQHFRQERYDPLRKILSNRGFLENEDEVKNFFLKEGPVILSWALDASTVEPLKFLADENIIPKQALQAVLRKRDFSVLRTFLYTQTGIQAAGRYTAELREVQIEKFKILLSIDGDEIRRFMNDSSDNLYLQTAITRNNFVEADRRFLIEENMSDEEFSRGL
jgi:hypothetical protein